MTARAQKQYAAALAAFIARSREATAALANHGERERLDLEARIRGRRRALELSHRREYFMIRQRFGFELGPGPLAMLEGLRHAHAG
jgi:hypothetical protein